nr:hypothetical protein [uncultured Chryseobacterium sp.]
MKNLKKLTTQRLKAIKGGIIPIGCISWDGRNRCCRQWDAENWNNPTCADAPPPTQP